MYSYREQGNDSIGTHWCNVALLRQPIDAYLEITQRYSANEFHYRILKVKAASEWV